MFPWHSTIAAGGNAVPAPTANSAIDAAYRELLQWLSSAPRDPQGKLDDPGAMLRALRVKLSSQGAGMLLALCDIKGQPSRDEFERCVAMAEQRSGYEQAPAAAPAPKGRGIGHLCSGAARAGTTAPGRGGPGRGGGGPGRGAGRSSGRGLAGGNSSRAAFR
eukprot:1524367-Prymnesium_polylepis.1